MRDTLDKSTKSQFDIKQGVGGVTDIEFLIQYSVLRWAATYPSLLDTTGMLPLLRRFAEYQLVDEIACEQLSIAFRTYRAEIHRLALQNQAALIENESFVEQRQQVKHWWVVMME